MIIGSANNIRDIIALLLRMRSRNFASKLKLGEQSGAWVESEIDDYLENLIAERSIVCRCRTSQSVNQLRYCAIRKFLAFLSRPIIAPLGNLGRWPFWEIQETAVRGVTLVSAEGLEPSTP